MKKEELNKYIGKKIKEFRVKKNLTQGELGLLLGIRNTTISAYETGVNTSDSDTLYLLARELDVNVDDFFPATDTGLPYLEKIKDIRSKNLKANEMLFFTQLVDKAASMESDERRKFLESMRFTIDHYDMLNRDN